MEYILKLFKMNQPEGFMISNYDWIGFDLDNTLVRYDPKYIIDSSYEGITKYLIEVKSYPQELFPPLGESNFLDFLRRGVIVDCKTGNLMTVNARGSILKASHGTRELSAREVLQIDPTASPFSGIGNNPHQILFTATKKFFLDFNTAPIPLIYALLIDFIEREGISQVTPLSVWKDVVESYEGYMDPSSALLNERFDNPERFIYPWGSNVLNWLMELKTHKKVFLVSNSPIDWVSTAAQVAIGPNWRDYFDVIICSAMKPLFFMRPSPFLNNHYEVTEQLELREVYHQGSWEYLYRELVRLGGTKALYIGDNIMLDIYSARKNPELDKVAIIEELGSEGRYPSSTEHPYSNYLNSSFWGSFLGEDFNTLWGDILQNHTKFCVPSLDELAALGFTNPSKPPWNIRLANAEEQLLQ